MATVDEASIVIGPEYDASVRGALKSVLAELGAQSTRRDWGMGGSQEVESLDVIIGERHLKIEAETYVGITVTGPVKLIEQIALLVELRRAENDRSRDP
jgi:hypothetical protein